MAKPNITADQLRLAFHYNAETGNFSRLTSPCFKYPIGSKVGTVGAEGYRLIKINRKQYRAARLAWLYVTGEWPMQIDHLNGDRSDDRFANLRDVTPAKNQQNRGHPDMNSASGFRGFERHGPGWRAAIVVHGKRCRGLVRPTPDLAHADYLAMKRKLHG